MPLLLYEMIVTLNNAKNNSHAQVHEYIYVKVFICQICCLYIYAVHSSEVLQLVERANKEVAIEALLNTFEEVWLSRQLELVTSEGQSLAINRQEVIYRF